MKILAIDPSICSLGIAIMEGRTVLKAGTLRTKLDWNERMKEIANIIKVIVEEHRPEALGIETQYLTWLNSNAVLKTCEVKGICRWVFMTLVKHWKVYDISPSTVKSALGLPGGRTPRVELKKMAIAYIRENYPHIKKVDDNTADAIWIGLAVFKENPLIFFPK